MNKTPSCNPKESIEPHKERDWRTMSIVEIAAENPSVFDYMKHWEERTLKAESKLDKIENLLRISGYDINSGE